jgi:FtsP/CotA-like multicopper oxidase with cupredoxin domain
MTLSRRQLFRTALSAGIVAPLAGCTGGGSSRPVDTTDRVSFNRPLPVPLLARAHPDDRGRRVFDLTLRAGRRELLPGRPADTWGVNGDHLGPTLRATRGEQVLINVHNGLDESTTLHWHGMHLPAVADGSPHQPIEPGQTWSPSWRMAQPAATLWYHPHPHGRTEEHTYRGLAGLFIVDDDEQAALDLPREYGVDDIPVIVQDKRFDGDGQLVAGEHGPTGLLGDTVLVNGTFGPYLDVPTERVRLRLLNASTARIYAFGLSDDRPLTLVGTDGGLLAAPVSVDRVQLSPGERAEVVVSLVPGERVVLRSSPPDLGTNSRMSGLTGGEDAFDLLELRAAANPRPVAAVPPRLVAVPRPDPAATTRTFELAGRAINGGKMDLDRFDEVVDAGSTEVWSVVNLHALPHNFHVHGLQFQVLDIDGGEPPAHLAGWKDTVYLPPRIPIRLLMRFPDYPDPAAPYMYHCHLSFHEDQGMMGQYVLVEPGQRPHHPPGH